MHCYALNPKVLSLCPMPNGCFKPYAVFELSAESKHMCVFFKLVCF